SAAGRALAREAESKECALRRLAARALVDSGSARAAPALRDLAGAEPEEPDAPDVVERVKRLFGTGGRCGAGDIARDGLRSIAEAR
ncbi:MAG TPA: hypothetical protein VF904_19020, partial [Anaeromyxobacteraceae bacterium]